MKQKKIESFIKILVGLTFLMPLILIPNSFIFPFIFPKVLFFRIMVLLMLAGYLLLLSSDWQRYKIKLTPTNLAVTLFFISFFVSTFVGVDWYKSFWDNHERMLGLFTIFHYVIYYFVITSIVREWRDWKWLLRVFLLAGSLVMIMGLWQKFVNPEFLLNRNNVRVSATLGNPIYYSGYGLFLFFAGFLLTVKEKKFSFWQWYAVVGGALGFLGVFAGGTRGTLLGMAAGLASLLISYIIFLKQNSKLRKVLMSVVVSGVVVIGILFAFRTTSFVKNIPLVGQVMNIDITEGTANTRLMAWGIAVEAWQEKPLFGWGPNNYYYAFNKYYRPEFLKYGWGETWFDNAHSSVMNTLAVQGIIGLLFYLGLFFLPFIVLWSGFKKGQINSHLVGVGSAFLIAHFVHNIFVFENPTSYLYFFLFLALLNSQTLHISVPKITTNNKKKVSGGMYAFILLTICLLIYSTNINPARANMKVLDTIKALSTGEDFIELYKQTTSIPSPHIDDIRNDFVRSVTSPIVNVAREGRGGQFVDLFDLAYGELVKNRVLHPLDIRVNMAQSQLAQAGAQIKQDVSFLYEAEEIMEDALKKSPKRQQIQYTLAQLKLHLNKPEEAIQIIKESIDNYSEISEGWWRLILVYRDIGDIEQAKRVIQEANDKGIVFNDMMKGTVESVLSHDSSEE